MAIRPNHNGNKFSRGFIRVHYRPQISDPKAAAFTNVSQILFGIEDTDS